LRAFARLGIFKEVASAGFAGDGIRVHTAAGDFLRQIDTPHPVDADVPGSGGILRPVLHEILSRHTLASGARVTLGTTLASLSETEAGVEVLLANGERRCCDLLIGADGLQSSVRQLLFPAAPRPEFQGQMIWRTACPRPPEVNCRHYFLGGPVKVGLCPVSATQMYLFLLETVAQAERIPEEQLPALMARMLAGYGGPLRAVRDALGPRSQIIRRPLEAFLLPAPWHSGRALLIGDAAHPTTPQLASGAGMAVEDALVLGEELARGGTAAECFARVMARRYARCRLVVESSLEIGRRERAGAGAAAQTELVDLALAALAAPY
jgi:2-polyprenyl-6-methoxyphenol hydroxylase-like FAD-dependent oxidoreductase